MDKPTYKPRGKRQLPKSTHFMHYKKHELGLVFFSQKMRIKIPPLQTVFVYTSQTHTQT